VISPRKNASSGTFSKKSLVGSHVCRYAKLELILDMSDLQEQMGRLGDTALVGGERTDAIDHLVAGIARLSSEVNDASTYLPAYDQRTYGEVQKPTVAVMSGKSQWLIQSLTSR
jgi:hypothetical protein